MQCDRCSAQPVRAVEPTLSRRQFRDLIHEHKDRSKYQHSYMHKTAGPGCGDARQFRCFKSPGVEGDGGMGIRDRQYRRQSEGWPFGDEILIHRIISIDQDVSGATIVPPASRRGVSTPARQGRGGWSRICNDRRLEHWRGSARNGGWGLDADLQWFLRKR